MKDLEKLLKKLESAKEKANKEGTKAIAESKDELMQLFDGASSAIVITGRKGNHGFALVGSKSDAIKLYGNLIIDLIDKVKIDKDMLEDIFKMATSDYNPKDDLMKIKKMLDELLGE